MNADVIEAYAEAVAGLVPLIEAFPREGDLFPTSPDDASHLERMVDAYADRANAVYDALAGNGGVIAGDRVIALAAGDLRLASSLLATGRPAAGDEEEWRTIVGALADLRGDMAEIVSVVRHGFDHPFGGTPASFSPEPGGPVPPAPRTGIPPLVTEDEQPARDMEQWRLLNQDLPQHRDFDLPIGGGAPDSTKVSCACVDEIVRKASGEISSLLPAVVSLPPHVAHQVTAELDGFLGGHLGPSYYQLQGRLRGVLNRAKRAAVKLLYEGIDKLLSLMRAGANAHDAVTGLAILAKWFNGFSLRTLAGRQLKKRLQIPALHRHIVITYRRYPDLADARNSSVGARTNTYKRRAGLVAPVRVGLRAARLLKLQHFAPPWSEIGLGVIVAALCGISAWMAQDALDHPNLPYVLNLVRGVRSAVDGQ
jgi:hypothetical protein